MAVRFESLKTVIERSYNNANIKVVLEPSKPVQGRFLLTVEGEGVTEENARDIAGEILAAKLQESDLEL